MLAHERVLAAAEQSGRRDSGISMSLFQTEESPQSSLDK